MADFGQITVFDVDTSRRLGAYVPDDGVCYALVEGYLRDKGNSYMVFLSTGLTWVSILP